MSRAIIRIKYEFFGRVQGVGFRYTAQALAHRYGLTGWVSNNYDGSVSMEVQGTASEIDLFLTFLQNDRYIRIEDYSCKEIPVDPEEHYFRIKR